MYMAAYNAPPAHGRRDSIMAGLCPEPQSVATQAAGAASGGIGVDAKNSNGGGKSVFGRHSTQSSIAVPLRRAIKEFNALGVDKAVYDEAARVYRSWPSGVQVPERAARAAVDNAERSDAEPCRRPPQPR